MTDSPRRTVYGRRQGRPLRKGRQALVDELLPRLAIELPAEGEGLDPFALFAARPDGLWLEIGFGGGEHLAWQAARHPGTGFLAAEYYINGIASLLSLLDAQGDAEGIGNVRIYRGDARDLLACLPEACLERVFILFPDPWRKTRHHKRRLVGRETLDRLALLMKPGGELRLATDHRDYLVWMLEAASGHPAFEWLARRPADWRERPADWPATRYEEKAVEEGRQPAFLRYRRRP